VGWLACWFIDLSSLPDLEVLACWLVDQLFARMVDCLVGWFAAWLAGWFVRLLDDLKSPNKATTCTCLPACWMNRLLRWLVVGLARWLMDSWMDVWMRACVACVPKHKFATYLPITLAADVCGSCVHESALLLMLVQCHCTNSSFCYIAETAALVLCVTGNVFLCSPTSGIMYDTGSRSGLSILTKATRQPDHSVKQPTIKTTSVAPTDLPINQASNQATNKQVMKKPIH
jgi:hypothetical protein